jgi:hypothetical protein
MTFKISYNLYLLGTYIYLNKSIIYQPVFVLGQKQGTYRKQIFVLHSKSNEKNVKRAKITTFGPFKL